MSKVLGDSEGVIRIHENVIATIIRKTALSVDGVSRIAGSSFVDSLAEMVGSKRMFDRAVHVEMGDSSVSAEVALNIFFGYKLPVVAKNVQKKVADEIERLTGLKVLRINVVVREIEDPPVKDTIG